MSSPPRTTTVNYDNYDNYDIMNTTAPQILDRQTFRADADTQVRPRDIVHTLCEEIREITSDRACLTMYSTPTDAPDETFTRWEVRLAGRTRIAVTLFRVTIQDEPLWPVSLRNLYPAPPEDQRRDKAVGLYTPKALRAKIRELFATKEYKAAVFSAIARQKTGAVRRTEHWIEPQPQPPHVPQIGVQPAPAAPTMFERDYPAPTNEQGSLHAHGSLERLSEAAMEDAKKHPSIQGLQRDYQRALLDRVFAHEGQSWITMQVVLLAGSSRLRVQAARQKDKDLSNPDTQMFDILPEWTPNRAT